MKNDDENDDSWVEELVKWSQTYDLGLPYDEGFLSNLTKLNCDCHGIDEIPDVVSQLFDLETVDLYGNGISELPESLFTLPKLKLLYLGKNCLKAIPESIIKCQTLEYLNINGNPLESLPESVWSMEKLEIVSDDPRFAKVVRKFGE